MPVIGAIGAPVNGFDVGPEAGPVETGVAVGMPMPVIGAIGVGAPSSGTGAVVIAPVLAKSVAGVCGSIWSSGVASSGVQTWGAKSKGSAFGCVG